MPRPLRLLELSSARQALVRLFQATNYGEIRQLQVKEAEPVLNPAPIVLVDLKLDTDDESRPELALVDFVLGHEVCRLLDRLDQVKTGEIERISIRAGIPRRIVLQSSQPIQILAKHLVRDAGCQRGAC
jgi:hypothetical protein